MGTVLQNSYYSGGVVDPVVFNVAGNSLHLSQNLAHFSDVATYNTKTASNYYSYARDDYILTSFTDNDDGTCDCTLRRLSDFCGGLMPFLNGYGEAVSGGLYVLKNEPLTLNNSIFSFWLPQSFTIRCVTSIIHTKSDNMYRATTGDVVVKPYFSNNLTSRNLRVVSSYDTEITQDATFPDLTGLNNVFFGVHNGGTAQNSQSTPVRVSVKNVISIGMSYNDTVYDPTSKVFTPGRINFSNIVRYLAPGFWAPFDVADFKDIFNTMKYDPLNNNDFTLTGFGTGLAYSAILFS